MVKGAGKLLESAIEHSPKSRALLFRHLCDLFLNDLLPADAEDRNALYEIVRLLRPRVDLAIRRELSGILAAADHPPEPLLRLLVDDVDEVSGPLLDRAKFPEAYLLSLINGASDRLRARLARRHDLPLSVKSALGVASEPKKMAPKPIWQETPAWQEQAEPEVAAIPRPSLVDVEQAKKLIRHQRGQLQDIVRAATDWQWETDRQGRFTYISDGATTAFGQPPAVLLGAAIVDLLAPANDIASAPALENALERLRPFAGVTVQSQAAGGKVSRWQVTAVPVFEYESGRFQGFRGTAVAVDHGPGERSTGVDRRRATAAPPPVAAHDATGDGKIDPAVLQAVQNLSHELRTPLNAILGFSEMIAHSSLGQVDERYQDYARKIVAAGQHLHGIIGEILNYAPLVAGKTRPKLRSLSLSQTVRAAIAAANEDAAGKPLSLVMEPEEIPAIVASDPQFLEASLTNILKAAVTESAAGSVLSIAIKSIPNGAVEVRVPLAQDDSGEQKTTSPLFDLHLSFAREIAKPLHCTVDVRPSRRLPRQLVLTISPAETAY